MSALFQALDACVSINLQIHNIGVTVDADTIAANQLGFE
jgi:hypothetical protein